MRITARCDYACKALLELSLYWPKKKPLQIHVISEKQGIPLSYLVQILIQLKRAGLVVSARGKEGGYNLAKPPKKIALGEVVRQIGGPILPISNSDSQANSAFASIWRETERSISKTLDNITFEDILAKARKDNGAIMYQI